MAQVREKRAVGRPREFDEDAALECAMNAFWAKGYEATSLADLCSCTGLHKGSLYQAFGDKHTLFLKALRAYADREFQETAAVAFEHESPLDSLRAIVRKVCGRAEEGKGCFMINSIVELAPHDPEVKVALQAEAERRTRIVGELLAKAQQRGEIREELKPQKLAQQLMIGLAGAATLVKGVITTPQVMDVLDDLIDNWT